jgi:hypothetical protein
VGRFSAAQEGKVKTCFEETEKPAHLILNNNIIGRQLENGFLVFLRRVLLAELRKNEESQRRF